MKKQTVKKIALGLMTFTLVFSVIGLGAPKKTNAQLATEDVHVGIETTLSQLSGVVTANATLGSFLKTNVLDKLATAIAKELLMQITASVVTWINSGFNGSPSFIQNPTAFFENVGDQLTGQFISSTGVLASLCSPFSLQVRLSIALKQQSLGAKQYSCTLSTIINNTTNAVKNASVSGFISGDFSQGGWSAFAALTMNPQNNPNGAYLIAEDDIQNQILAKQTQKASQLLQGNGFLSWESCTPTPPTPSPTIGLPTAPVAGDAYQAPAVTDVTDFSSAVPGLPSNTTSATAQEIGIPTAATAADAYNAGAEADPNQTCTTQTPGSVISSALNKHLGVPTTELELANSINDIINAAFSELVVIALQKGLTSVSAANQSGSSYLQSAINSDDAESFSSSQSTIITTVTPLLASAQSVAANYNSALTAVSIASSTVGQAQSCYQNILASSSTNEYPYAVALINNQLNSLAALEPALASTSAAVTMDVNTASTTLNEYQQVYDQTESSQQLSDLTAPNLTLENLSQAGNLPGADTVQSSANDLSTFETTVQPIQQQALTSLNQCQSFNYLNYGSASSTTATSTASTSSQ